MMVLVLSFLAVGGVLAADIKKDFCNSCVSARLENG